MYLVVIFTMKRVPREKVRDHILDVAKKLFLEKGFLNTSIRDIAKEGGLTVGRMYVYFKKKDHIFIEIIKPTLNIIEKRTLPEVLDSESEEEKISNLYSKERFKENLRKNYDYINSYREEFKLAFFKSDGFNAVDIREKIINSYKINHEMMVNILKKRGHSISYDNNEHVANSLAKIYVSVYEELIAGNMSDRECDIYIDKMADFLYYGHLGLAGYESITDLEYEYAEDKK